MALPADVSTFTLTFGHATNGYTDSTGAVALVGVKAKLFPVDLVTGARLVVTHVASGQVIVPTAVTVTINAQGKGSVGPLPHTDNPTLSPVGFGYRLEWQVGSGSRRVAPRDLTFAAPVAAGATVEFDLLEAAEAVPGVLVPNARSVNGKTGAVVLDAEDVGAVPASGLDAAVAPLVENTASATGMRLRAASAALLTGPRVAVQSGRRGFELSLTERATRKIIGVYVGASTIEGSVAATFDKLSLLLEKMFQSSYNPPGISGGYTLKAREAGQAWATTGTTGEILDIDLKKIRTLAAGATLTHVTRGPSTGLQVMYSEGPGQGAFTVTIDGYAPFTITPDTTKPTNSPTGVWESPSLPRAVHTFVITAIGACQIGNTVIRDGDRDLGFTLYNAGRAGGSTSVFVGAGADTTWQRITALHPDIVPVQLGHNDMGSNDIATYKANLRTIVGKINAASPDKTVWIPMIGQQSTDARFPAYLQAMSEVAGEFPNCTYFSYHDYFPSTVADVDANTEGLWFTDYTHLVSKGHEYAASLIADHLGLPSRRTWQGVPPAADNLAYDWKTDTALLFDYDPNALAETTGASVASLPSARGTITTPMTQATTAKQPTVVAGPNGRKAIATLATAQQEIGASFANQTTPATIISIFKRGTAASTRAFSGMSTSYLAAATTGSPLVLRLESGAGPTWDTDYTSDTNWHVLVAVFDGTGSRRYYDGRVPITGATAANRTWNGIALGRNPGGTAWSDSQNARLIGFSRALTSYEVGRVLDDLAAQYALPVAS